MGTVIRAYPGAKAKMSVGAIQWIPGALAATLPLFAMSDPSNGTLYLRADDPNIYGVYTGGLQQSPIVVKNNIQKAANKGCNFYSAPWCISTLPARDLGRRVEITSVHQSVYDYITALYGLISREPITLTDWRFEKAGYVKSYQILQGSSYVNVGTTTYFGGSKLPNTQVSGVSELTAVSLPLITNDFTYGSGAGPYTSIVTYKMTYNTFYAVDTPIVISAVDTSNAQIPRIYFTLMNNVTMYNGPNYDA
jgi:hypothetical protein